MTARALLNASRQRVLRLRRVIMALWQLVLSLLVAFAPASVSQGPSVLPGTGRSMSRIVQVRLETLEPKLKKYTVVQTHCAAKTPMVSISTSFMGVT